MSKQPSGHWWCHECKKEVDPTEVTYQENHSVCGYAVFWHEDKLEQEKKYGFYQLCPKCDGEKEIPDNTISSVGNISLTRPCPICKGEGVIPRPEIKNMQP